MKFVINLHFTILANFSYYLINFRFDFASKTPKQAEKSIKNKNSTSKPSKNLDDDGHLEDGKSKPSAKLSSSKMSGKKIVTELEDEIEE